MRKVVLGVAIGVLALPTWAASFDCAKAQTIVEESICSDEKLGMLDEMLSANYKAVMAAAKATNPGYVDTLKANQKEWMKERNECTDINCITIAYADRVTDICERAMINGVDVENCTKYDASADDGGSQQPVQLQEMPFKIQTHPNNNATNLTFTALTDFVTINRIEVNRGNCKTVDLISLRAAKDAKVRLLNGNGIMKFGDTHTFYIPRCDVLEMNVITNLGSWTVTMQ